MSTNKAGHRAPNGDRTDVGRGVMPRRGIRWQVTGAAVVAMVVGLLAPMAGAPFAQAAVGSLVSGVAWGDTDRDGVHDADEVEKSGVSVQLLSSPGGAVIATTTTDANGVYSFADVEDGAYTVRVTADGPSRFPAAASGDNDFTRAGNPPPGQPERGVSAPFTITGATQGTGLDAGLRPNRLAVAWRP